MTSFNVKAPKFRGTKFEDLDTFLSQLKLRFQEAGIQDDKKKTILTIECLQGEAARWAAGKVNRLTAGQELVPHVWANYEAFIKFLREQSGQYYDIGETAESQINNIEQGCATILQFNAKFNQIVGLLPAGYGPAVLKYNYLRALNPGTRNRLASTPGSHEWTYEKWMENAENLHRGEQHLGRIHKPYVPKFGGATKTYQPPADPDAMDVDTVYARTENRRKGRGQRPRYQQSAQRNACYRCGKSGHWQKDCQQQKKIPSGSRGRVPMKRRQLEVVPEDETQVRADWEEETDLEEEEDHPEDFQEVARTRR